MDLTELTKKPNNATHTALDEVIANRPENKINKLFPVPPLFSQIGKIAELTKAFELSEKNIPGLLQRATPMADFATALKK